MFRVRVLFKVKWSLMKLTYSIQCIWDIANALYKFVFNWLIDLFIYWLALSCIHWWNPSWQVVRPCFRSWKKTICFKCSLNSQSEVWHIWISCILEHFKLIIFVFTNILLILRSSDIYLILVLNTHVYISSETVTWPLHILITSVVRVHSSLQFTTFHHGRRSQSSDIHAGV